MRVFVCIFLFICLFPSISDATSQGWRNCATTADNSSVGTASWATTANACGSDNTYATVSVTGTAQSHYLKVTNFGFSGIPNDAVVTGIKLEVELKSTTSGSNVMDDSSVRLLKAGTPVGTDKAVAGSSWPTTDTATNYGGINDVWGTTWMGSDITNANFGVVISGVGHTGSGSKTVTGSVDNIKLTVYYQNNSAILTSAEF